MTMDTNEGQETKTPPKLNPSVIIELSNCKYDIVRQCAASLGWTDVKNSDDWTICWMDTSVAPERVMRLKNFQRINHFPGMNGICRKVPLARNLNRMKKQFPEDYDFIPQSWTLPHEREAFKREKLENKTFIIKPSAGCQGKGIILTRDRDEVDKHGDSVVQVYLDSPFLIEGYKFDLRVYFLVVSVDPLRILLFKDGLVRLCTEPYKKPSNRNMKIPYMHLTNYSLNKNNDQFEKTDDFSKGSKRNFAFLNGYIRSQGHDPDAVWEEIAGIAIKTVLSIQPQLKHQYRSCMSGAKNGDFCCFEILGFDIFLDDKLKPWLLEVNHSPSFNTDTLLDRVVKRNLIIETMKLLMIDPNDRIKSLKFEKAKSMERIKGKNAAQPVVDPVTATREELHEKHTKMEDEIMQNYFRIYPCAGHEKYDRFIEFALKAAQRAGDPLVLSTLAKTPDAKEPDNPRGAVTARPKSSLSQASRSVRRGDASPRSHSSLGKNSPSSPRSNHTMTPLSPRDQSDTKVKSKIQVQSRYLSFTKRDSMVALQREPAIKLPTHELRLPNTTTLMLDLPFSQSQAKEIKKQNAFQPRRLVMHEIFF